MGCREIEDQIRSIGSCAHVFGHSHIAIDDTIDGLRYVQQPLGYPHDWYRKTTPTTLWGKATTVSSHTANSKPKATLHEQVHLKQLSLVKKCDDSILLQRPNVGKWLQEEAEAQRRRSVGHAAGSKSEPVTPEAKQNGHKYGNSDSVASQMTHPLHGAKAAAAPPPKSAKAAAAPPPPQKVTVKISHTEESDTIDVEVMDNATIKDLKNQIVQQVGRGPASKIMLTQGGETLLPDGAVISNIISTWGPDIALMGISIRPPAKVQIKVTSIREEPPVSVLLSVLDTATILDVRKALLELMQKEEPSKKLSQVKIVNKLGGQAGFSTAPDDERLNGRKELFAVR
jgi:hypothetical protein